MKASSVSVEACLNCSKYIGCSNPKKAFSYICEKYKPVSKQEIAEILNSKTAKPKNVDKLIDDPSTNSEFNIRRMVEDVINDKSIVPVDVKMNDRHIPKAKNFYEFCTGEEFLNIKPFLQQCLIGTVLNAEYCPRCTDMDYLLYDHKVSDSLKKFTKRVALMENGECPYCGTTKSKLVAKEKLHYYQELIAVCGQRCVTGDTLVLTSDGIVEIGDYVGNRPYGFSDFNIDFHTGDEKRNASRFYRSRPEICKCLTTKLGYSITGTKDHPVMTLDGFKRLEEIAIGNYVRVYYGQNVFGNKNVILKDITAKADRKFKKWYDRLEPRHKKLTKVPRRKPGCGQHNIYELNIDVAKLIGYWLAEGRYRTISNTDQNVLKHCFDTLVKMFGEYSIKQNVNTVEFSNKYVQIWLETFLGIDIFAKSSEKAIPKIILQATKEIQTAFLSSLFEGDGSIHKHREKNTYIVSYSSISKKLVDQLSIMLLNIGIQHRRRARKTWATNGSNKQIEKDSFEITITGNALVKFSYEIGFQSERKNSKLSEAVLFYKNKENNVPHYYEKLPVPMHNEFISLVEDIKLYLNNLPDRGKNCGYVGLRTIFGNQNHRSFTRADRQRTATKSDLLNILKPIVDSGYLLSPKLYARIEVLLDYAKSKYYYDTVISNLDTEKEHETYDVTIPQAHRFISNGFLSHNSGKSAITAMLSAYHIHRLVKLSKPNEVYGLLHSNILHINFVALTFQGAKNLLYDPLFGYLIESPWFVNYHNFLLDYEKRTGESIFKLNDTFLMYRHRALIVAPLGPDRRSLRGKTRYGGAIDEICHFPNDNVEAVKLNASEVYIAIERSLLTIRASANKLLAKGFNDIPTGMFWNISSPYSVRDKGMEVLRASQNSRKIYGIQKPTWEMNPTVTKEDLQSEFDKDEVTAMRDYGAQPALTSNAFVTNEESVSNCLGKRSNGIKLTMAQRRFKNNDAERYAKVANIANCNYPSILAIDAGVTNNSFGLVCGHMLDEKFITTIATEIIPLPGIPLNFTLIYENVIKEIIDAQNVVLVVADRWNSIKVLSDIRVEFGIDTEQYSLKYKDMWYTKDFISQNNLILPKCEKTVKECIEYDIDNYPYSYEGKPIEHLILQILTVRDTGSSVIKGDGNLTDDIFRALCLAIHRINDTKHADLFAAEYEEEQRSSGPGHLAVVRGGVTNSSVGSTSISGASGRSIAVARRSRS